MQGLRGSPRHKAYRYWLRRTAQRRNLWTIHNTRLASIVVLAFLEANHRQELQEPGRWDFPSKTVRSVGSLFSDTLITHHIQSHLPWSRNDILAIILIPKPLLKSRQRKERGNNLCIKSRHDHSDTEKKCPSYSLRPLPDSFQEGGFVLCDCNSARLLDYEYVAFVRVVITGECWSDCSGSDGLGIWVLHFMFEIWEYARIGCVTRM